MGRVALFPLCDDAGRKQPRYIEMTTLIALAGFWLPLATTTCFVAGHPVHRSKLPKRWDGMGGCRPASSLCHYSLYSGHPFHLPSLLTESVATLHALLPGPRGRVRFGDRDLPITASAQQQKEQL